MDLLSNMPVHHGNEVIDPSIILPVIDLGDALGDHRRHVVDDITNAGKEFGFFQVVNHGVGEATVRNFREAAAAFFAMPAEEKMRHYSNDMTKAFRVATSTPYDGNDGEQQTRRHWRDYLKLQCLPVDKFVHYWPARPETFRESLATYATEVRDLAMTISRLLAEGLGLDGGFFEGDLSGGDTEMAVNYYPPCPEPSLTLGLLPHCDRHLLTVLSQGDVGGLQVKYMERWMAVKPIANAFVVNIAHQMEIVSNGVLKSVEHRAVTNSSMARLSVGLFVMPNMDCRIAPVEELVNEDNPPMYREFFFSDFLGAYNVAAADRKGVLDFFKI